MTITDLAPTPGRQSVFHLKVMHFLTPQAQHSMHYNWFVSRDFLLDSDDVSTSITAGMHATFLQDKDALEAITQLKASEPDRPFEEVSFASDRPGLEALRVLLRLADAKQTAPETLHAVSGPVAA